MDGLKKRWTRETGRGHRWLLLPVFLLTCLWPRTAGAQITDIAQIIQDAVKKVIVAVDLEVERLQTETISLQNAEKAVENAMDLSELNDITSWVQQQKDLFAEYYNELWQVKNALATYEQVKSMIEKQVQIVAGFRQAYSILGQDQHFSAAEVNQMYAVLSGIATQSAQNINRLTLVITGLLTQMNDAGRLRIIDETGSDIDKNYRDLAQFSQQNYLLSLQRAKDENDVAATQALYGIQ
jgi:hypothetical protein